MKRHPWPDLKARMKPETRERLEAEAQQLSEEVTLVASQRDQRIGQRRAAGGDEGGGNTDDDHQ